MRCPHCGAETPDGKFCGSCGGSLAPVSAQSQPQPPAYSQQAPAYQPADPSTYRPAPPAPPKQRGLAWLWITLGVAGVLVLGIVALLFLGGPKPAGPKGSTGPVAADGAEGVVRAYLDARKQGDLAAAYGTLSPKAQASFTEAEYAAYYKDFELVSYGTVQITQAQDPWYRVAVKDVAYSDMTVPEATYTVNQVDGKFYLALDTPLLTKVDKAYAASQFDTVLQVTGQMLAIDPFSYNASYNKGWALLDSKQYDQGLAALQEAEKYVAPDDRPELTRSIGIAYGRLRLWAQAADQLAEARQLGQALPDAYEAAWLRSVVVDLVTAYQNKGDTIQAHDLLEKLYQEDPEDETVHAMAVKYERLPYNVTGDGFAHYRLFLQGVSFALPKDWVVSSETTGGDWWYARHPETKDPRVDLGVRFRGDSLGATLEEAAQGLLKEKREPIGAPPQDVSIVNQASITLAKQPALRIEFSDGTTSFLLKARDQWVDVIWFDNPTAKAAIPGWLETVGTFD